MSLDAEIRSFFDEYENRSLLAAAVGLPESELLPFGLPAQVVSTAVPQLMVPAASLQQLGRIEVDPAALRRVMQETESDCLMIFTRECVHPGGTVHARMFAPGFGEDPATGSAAGALGAYLVRQKLVAAEPTARILVEQGYDPEGYTLYTYATVQVWAQAAEKAGSTDLEAVIEQLNSNTFETVLGPITFDEKGDVTGENYVFFEWDNGEYHQLGG